VLIEEPFSTLPLHAICNSAEKNVRELTRLQGEQLNWQVIGGGKRAVKEQSQNEVSDGGRRAIEEQSQNGVSDGGKRAVEEQSQNGVSDWFQEFRKAAEVTAR
jgi:hypothetical protein